MAIKRRMLADDGKPVVREENAHHAGFGDAEIMEAPMPDDISTRPESPPPFRWNIDRTTDGEVAGWIMMPSRPSYRCTVLLREGPRDLARAVAATFRRDLVEAGIGDGNHSFSLDIPAQLHDGADHYLEVIEEETGLSLTPKPIHWRPHAAAAESRVFALDTLVNFEGADPRLLSMNRSAAVNRNEPASATAAGTRLLFDISDLVYYIGEHANLTGIQRVQSSIVLAILANNLLPRGNLTFLSFDARRRNWVSIPAGFLRSLLQDLFLPEGQRIVHYPREEARYGILPGATPFDGSGILDNGGRSVLCLLGAAWVHQDYLHRVLALKRRYGTRFVMTVHDLIPIYARETCDQDTAKVFEEFMRRALRHVDHILAVSENTANDVRRYLATLQLPEPPITVTRNGSSFAEFLPSNLPPGTLDLLDLPERFVLFVATIEGRKNHQLMLEIWQRMIADGDDPPHLICVGRLGWKSSTFISALVETGYLGGRIHLLRDISDADLRLLYERCLFTVCPTLYEGWGLPVGEALAMGKICVCSDRASLPEVAGECGVYIDINSVDRSLETIRTLIGDDKQRRRLEARIRREFVPVSWRSVAEKVAASCEQAVDTTWREPYPFTLLPFSTEISFGRLDRDTDGTGELLLTRIAGARRGLFLSNPLDERSFLLGEEIRAGGSWAQPEQWGTWLCHGSGDVSFSLAADQSRLYYVLLRLRVSGLLHDHPVRISANGDVMWVNTIGPEPKNVLLCVRKSTQAMRPWRLRLSTSVDLSTDTLERIAALDGRVPTIGFERLIVVPEDDLKTRLDLLYRTFL